ncbi:MAG: gltX [Parcubacteria group bacterium]|nr:gltX [Parcubacteria group bacterium]
MDSFSINVTYTAQTGVRTRFAPSPTGQMHVGGIRTALYAWLFALQHGGEFILRIEDTDKSREIEGSIGHIMESLKWLGIKWSEGIDVGGAFGPYLQSERLDIYLKYAHKLITDGHAYPDPYTEEEVQAFREAAEAEKRPFLYRDHRPTTMQEWDGKAPLRFKVPEIKRYEWNDLIRGTMSAGEEALDDFILIKSDGFPTYNFAHVVDDYEMKITHIMRGEEFISSTPKFLSLYDALGIQRPEIATMPVILGAEGTKKLGKRDGAKDILDYRSEGYLPEAMRNFLALLGWHPTGDEEKLSTEDLFREFKIERVQKSGAQFDEQKLLHLNREWMRDLSPEEYVERGNLVAHLGLGEDAVPTLLKLVPILKERAHTYQEAWDMLIGELASIFKAPELQKESLLAKEPAEGAGSTKAHLEAVLGLMKSLHEEQDADAVKAVLMPYADGISKENGGRGAALWPLRYALSGAERSPDPFTLISILGKGESISRIQTALGILG